MIPRELSDTDMVNRALIGQLRGYSGQLRRAIRETRDMLLRHEHKAPITPREREAVTILSSALSIPFPDQP